MKKVNSRWMSAMLASTLAFGLLLTGCSSGEATPGTTTPGTTAPAGDGDKSVTIAMTGDVGTWNPWEKNEVVSNSIQLHIFDPLIDISNDLTMVPALATEWSTSDDGATWDFTLREGVTFSNGAVFNADDVVYSVERCKEVNKAWADSLGTVDSVEKVDDTHVKFICNTNDAILPSSLKSILMLDKETTEGLSIEELDTTVIGTGRYKLDEYVRDDYTVLSVNDKYWGEKPEAEKVTFRAIANDGTRTASLMGKEVDMIANVPVTDVAMLKTKDFLNVQSVPSIGVMFYQLAQVDGDPSPDAPSTVVSPDGTNPLNVRDVRYAMMLAIDNDTLVNVIQQGYASVAPTCVPAGFNGYNPNIQDYGYDPAEAEAMLDAAGYPRQGDGYRFAITMDCTNDRYINDAATATAIASYLDKVGIKVNVNAMSRSVFFGYISIDDDLYQSHFYQGGWSDTSGESVLIARDLIYGTNMVGGTVKENYGGANRSYYNNPEVNAMIDEAMATSDYDARDAIMQDVWQIVHDDVATFTSFFTNDVYAVNSRVEYTPRPDQFIFAWNFSFPA